MHKDRFFTFVPINHIYNTSIIHCHYFIILVRDIDMVEFLSSDPAVQDAHPHTNYDLLANICHDGPASELWPPLRLVCTLCVLLCYRYNHLFNQVFGLP